MKRIINHMNKLFCLGCMILAFHWGHIACGWICFASYFFISIFVSDEDKP